MSRISERSDLGEEDREELESHLLDSVDDLVSMGLTEDEAAIIAIRRLGSENELISLQVQKRSDKLWKSLAGRKSGAVSDADAASLKERILAGAGLAAVILLSLIPSFSPGGITGNFWRYFLNLSMMVLPVAALYHIARRWIRGERPKKTLILPALLLLSPLLVNFYPFPEESQTLILSGLHIPLGAWIIFSVFRDPDIPLSVDGKMDFIRFSGEVTVYSVLIGLAAAALSGLSVGLFFLIDINIENAVLQWIFPVVPPALLYIGMLLVQQKRSLVENFAPVLARIIAVPLLLILLLFLVLFVLGGASFSVDRDVLILMDAMLLAVIAVVVFSVSTRGDRVKYRFQDAVNLGLIVIALAIDAFVLAAMVYRLGEYGISPNKITSLVSNILLLGNLSLLALFNFRHLRSGVPAGKLLTVQGNYFIVYLIWFMTVGLVFPVVFSFI